MVRRLIKSMFPQCFWVITCCFTAASIPFRSGWCSCRPCPWEAVWSLVSCCSASAPSPPSGQRWNTPLCPGTSLPLLASTERQRKLQLQGARGDIKEDYILTGLELQGGREGRVESQNWQSDTWHCATHVGPPGNNPLCQVTEMWDPRTVLSKIYTSCTLKCNYVVNNRLVGMLRFKIVRSHIIHLQRGKASNTMEWPLGKYRPWRKREQWVQQF